MITLQLLTCWVNLPNCKKGGPVLILLYPTVQLTKLDKVVQKLIIDLLESSKKKMSFTKIYEDKDCVRKTLS